MIPLDQPLDLDAPDAAAFLAGLQGNILSSHGRDHTAHIFVRFGADAASCRAWLADLAAHRVTSAADQQVQRRAYKAHGGPGELFASLLLSQTGYIALGIAADRIPREPGGAPYFELGMKRQAEAARPFNDPPVERWEAAFQGDVHALVILAHDDAAALAAATDGLCRAATAAGATTWIEPGARLERTFPDGVERTIEHFGFEDGISNPQLILQDAIREREERGATHWDGVGSLDLVLVAEPGAPDRFGSFLVFRKLEQDVHGFAAAVDTLAAQLGVSAADAGALAVGRFADGTPVVPATAPKPGAKLNDFTFAAADPAGARCPFHAHIRKTNPRGDLPIGLPIERSFRIVRRGVTYGARPDLAAAAAEGRLPSTGVGLLFMSYQARLDQFAIQQEGSDSNDFRDPATGVDAVIGQNEAPVPQEWPTGSGRRFTMANFVRMLGGEYFFAPSMAFLRELGGAP